MQNIWNDVLSQGLNQIKSVGKTKVQMVSICNEQFKSILWRLAEIYYNGGLQRPYTAAH